VVGLLQLAGLLYGLWTVHLARPVHMVFEIDRFRVVHQVDIPSELRPARRPASTLAPWAAHADRAAALPRRREQLDDTMAALQGVPHRRAPDCGSPTRARARVLQAARAGARAAAPLSRSSGAEIDAALQRPAGRRATRHTCP
jgi:hypothetical protein